MRLARGGLALAIGAASVVGAIVLSVLQPTEELRLAPYAATVDRLDRAYDARQFTLTVTDVRLADGIRLDEWRGDTTGVWLVVDAEFARRIDRGGIQAELTIGRTTYASSVRLGFDGLDTATGQPDLPWAGSIAFELPEEALTAPGADHARVRFSTTSNPALDGVLDLPLDLGDLERSRELTLVEAARIPG